MRTSTETCSVISRLDDAEAEVMPELTEGVGWEEIKSFFRAEARRLFHAL